MTKLFFKQSSSKLSVVRECCRGLVLGRAKTFELKPYAGGSPANPMIFDKPDAAVPGCNIHDQVPAYIQIVDTPYFAETDAFGEEKLDELPVGKYELKAWHVNLPTGTPTPEQALVYKGGEGSASFRLNGQTTVLAN